MRVPPQMKKFSATGRGLHGRGDAPQPQALHHGSRSYRAQKTAGRNIDHTIDECRLMIMRTGDRQITVGQTGRPHNESLLSFVAGSVEPNAFVAAEGPQAKFATDR